MFMLFLLVNSKLAYRKMIIGIVITTNLSQGLLFQLLQKV
jgi:hypothetical protein